MALKRTLLAMGDEIQFINVVDLLVEDEQVDVTLITGKAMIVGQN